MFGTHSGHRSAYALWAEAIEAIQKYGTMVKSPTGFPIQSPYISIANRQAEIMIKIASEFGFTPASRGRISMLLEAEPDLFNSSPRKSSSQSKASSRRFPLWVSCEVISRSQSRHSPIRILRL